MFDRVYTLRALFGVNRIRNQHFALKFLASLALALTAAQPARAQSLDKDKVRKVEAAYLYNFAKFIRWPSAVFENTDSPFIIAVLGHQSFARMLGKTVQAKTIAGRPIHVKLVHSNEKDIRDAFESCHILYIASGEQKRVSGLIATLSNRSVLLVSDAKDFARKGGMIGFASEKGRIVFEINRASLECANLKASSKLMKLARVVDNGK